MKPDVISAYATVAAASVAAIAAGVSSYQTAVAVKQTNISQIQAELSKAQNDLASQQLKISLQQTDLTRQQADIAVEAEQLQLRSYISMHVEGYSRDKEGIWHLKTKIKNIGLTPALNVRFFFDQYVGELDASRSDSDWAEALKLGTGPFDLAQGEESGYDMQVNSNVPDYKNASVGMGVKTIMRVDYDDVFKRPRNTYLCYIILKHEKEMVSVERCYSPNPT